MAIHTNLPVSAPKVTLSWTSAKLVPEALEVNLHVLEDDRMISWLGRDKFVHLCIHGTSGWQTGVFFDPILFFFCVLCALRQPSMHVVPFIW